MNGSEALGAEERSALQDLKDRLYAAYGSTIAKFALFGSRARGDAGPDSDVDVAIVIGNLTPEERLRILQIVSEVELEHLVPLSTLVLSSAEYSRLLQRERRLALDIEQEGIPL